MVNTGDNFYPYGLKSFDGAQVDTSWRDVYRLPHPALAPLPWLSVLGNHDYRAMPEAEVLLAANDALWVMPARYYKLTPPKAAARGISLELFFIDTNPFIPFYAGKSLGINNKTT